MEEIRLNSAQIYLDGSDQECRKTFKDCWFWGCQVHLFFSREFTVLPNEIHSNHIFRFLRTSWTRSIDFSAINCPIDCVIVILICIISMTSFKAINHVIPIINKTSYRSGNHDHANSWTIYLAEIIWECSGGPEESKYLIWVDFIWENCEFSWKKWRNLTPSKSAIFKGFSTFLIWAVHICPFVKVDFQIYKYQLDQIYHFVNGLNILFVNSPINPRRL